MKNKVLYLLLFILSIGFSQAQKLVQKIGENPTIINSSAAFEIESTTKGLLPPRMTQAQMNAIGSPANGLLVVCSDCSPSGLRLFNGVNWSSFSTVSTRVLYVTKSTVQNIPAANTLITGWDAVTDPFGNCWNSSTGVFTNNTGARLRIKLTVRIQFNPTNMAGSSLYQTYALNGLQPANTEWDYSFPNQTQFFAPRPYISKVITLNVNDTLSFWINPSIATALHTNGSSLMIEEVL